MISNQRNIIITGFMGTGKTTVGKEVARRLKREFYDIDQMIEAETQMSIPEIFSRCGEKFFREKEKKITQKLLSRAKGAVISTGGGTLLSSDNRKRFADSGIIFCLSARKEVLKRRLNHPLSRPLLKTNPDEIIKTLLKKRSHHYGKFPNQIDTSDLSVEEVARKIVQTYQGSKRADFHTSIRVRLKTHPGSNSYAIWIKPGILAKAGDFLKKNGLCGKIFILTNRKVFSLYYKRVKDSLEKSAFSPQAIIIPDGEKYKSLETYNYVVDQLIEYKADRHSLLLTLGGGVICDLGGFVAATYMRGIKLVHLPTTLVAQIDASLGGKVAVDHRHGKNLIGAFYNPQLVLADPEALSTLSRKDLLNGILEAIKISLVCNQKLFFFIRHNLKGILKRDGYLLKQLIIQCVREKVKIVQKDPYERNLRSILNFGHTFGHALETNEEYKRITHGEAIGLGMLVALCLSNLKGHLPKTTAEEISTPIRSLTRLDLLKKINRVKIWGTITLDKKGEQGKVRFVLLQDLGKPIIEEVNKQAFFKALEKI